MVPSVTSFGPVTLILALIFTSAMAEVPGYLTSLEDASEVTWAHAVNSRGQLEDALSGEVDFLEADISMGHVIDRESGPAIPIMAHPPDSTSDISLEHWLDLAIARDSGKGLKLDFKFIEAVEPTLLILKKHERKINFPLWLNADILPGPVNSTQDPVSAHEFISLCHSHFPNATLSVGWVTYWFETFPPETWKYGWNHVRAMADILTCAGFDKDHKLTFPVRAVFACRSIPELRWLLETFPSSTLTVWSGKQDSVEVEDLLKIRKSFKAPEVYYDVPEKLRLEFDFRKRKIDVFRPHVGELGPEGYQWTIVKDTSSDQSCSSKTFIGNETLFFGKNSTVALITKSSFVVDDISRLRIQGKVTFFSSKDNGSIVSGPGNHQLVLILADDKDFSSQGGSLEVMNATLKTMNEYQLHKFQQNFTVSPWSCHFFRLDTLQDKMFQAWTMPCDMKDMSEEEIMMEGVAEIPRSMRLVLPPGPLKFGFISSGDGHVVVQDLNIDGMEAVSVSGSTPTVPSGLLMGALLVLALLILL